MVNITVNGKDMEVPEGTNVLDAALNNGIHVEHFATTATCRWRVIAAPAWWRSGPPRVVSSPSAATLT